MWGVSLIDVILNQESTVSWHALLPICTVATAVKAMCKCCGRVSGCDSNPNSKYFPCLHKHAVYMRTYCYPEEIYLEILTDLHSTHPRKEKWLLECRLFLCVDGWVCPTLAPNFYDISTQEFNRHRSVLANVNISRQKIWAMSPPSRIFSKKL
jgi:hypothetical protein